MALHRIGDWPQEPCTDREHAPPAHVRLEPGVYVHTCPACLYTHTIIVPKVTNKGGAGISLADLRMDEGSLD